MGVGEGRIGADNPSDGDRETRLEPSATVFFWVRLLRVFCKLETPRMAFGPSGRRHQGKEGRSAIRLGFGFVIEFPEHFVVVYFLMGDDVLRRERLAGECLQGSGNVERRVLVESERLEIVE